MLKNIFFFNFDDVEPLIFWSLVFEFINHFLVERREKKAGGVNFFHFLWVHFSSVQDLVFGTGVGPDRQTTCLRLQLLGP